MTATTTAFDDYPTIMKAALATFVFLREMGYPSDDIYLAFKKSTVYVTVKHCGQSFDVRIGSSDGSADDIERQWTRIGEDWNNRAIPSEAVERYVRETGAFAPRHAAEEGPCMSDGNKLASVDLDLDAIDADCAAASPGPWEHGTGFCGPFVDRKVSPTGYLEPPEHEAVWLGGSVFDADLVFIARARERVPLLAREVRKLRECLAAVRTIATNQKIACADAEDAGDLLGEADTGFTRILAALDEVA